MPSLNSRPQRRWPASQRRQAPSRPGTTPAGFPALAVDGERRRSAALARHSLWTARSVLRPARALRSGEAIGRSRPQPWPPPPHEFLGGVVVTSSSKQSAGVVHVLSLDGPIETPSLALEGFDTPILPHIQCRVSTAARSPRLEFIQGLCFDTPLFYCAPLAHFALVSSRRRPSSRDKSAFSSSLLRTAQRDSDAREAKYATDLKPNDKRGTAPLSDVGSWRALAKPRHKSQRRPHLLAPVRQPYRTTQKRAHSVRVISAVELVRVAPST
jgi:hypothetical protein